jgi:hypothetical protein
MAPKPKRQNQCKRCLGYGHYAKKCTNPSHPGWVEPGSVEPVARKVGKSAKSAAKPKTENLDAMDDERLEYFGGSDDDYMMINEDDDMMEDDEVSEAKGERKVALPAESTFEEPPREKKKRTTTCGLCHRTGHYSKTCPTNLGDGRAKAEAPKSSAQEQSNPSKKRPKRKAEEIAKDRDSDDDAEGSASDSDSDRLDEHLQEDQARGDDDARGDEGWSSNTKWTEFTIEKAPVVNLRGRQSFGPTLPPTRPIDHGPVSIPYAATQPGEFLGLLWDTVILNTFVTSTNSFVKNQPKPPWLPAKDMDIAELRRFFGLHLFMGVSRLPDRNMYWSNTVFGSTFVKSVMSRNRFMLIQSNLHWIDTSLIKGQMNSYYSDNHRVQKWQQRMINHFLHVTMNNARILFNGDIVDNTGAQQKYKSTVKSHTLLQFTKVVVEEWCDSQSEEPVEELSEVDEDVQAVTRLPTQPQNQKQMWIKEHRRRTTGKHTPLLHDWRNRSICVICKSKIKSACSQCGVALCFAPSRCFERFHNLEDPYAV